MPTLTLRTLRILLLPVLVLAVVAAQLVYATASRADDASTLTVVGTSDVYDSNLVQTVLKPGFEAAYPQYTLNYVSKGTGAAIAYAEAGTASALLVHAAALENQFVDGGYSLEPYGRAIFWGDYVLLGPAADPAGVLSGGEHDIATAFEKIAAAGELGQANFVSRGGTPGTTVQEHAIWGLTSGVTTCTVSDVNGGGTSPSTTTGDCPATITYPSWYHATGLTQGPNILNADACNYPSNEGNCYVLTDRGTFNYLVSTSAINDLQIVTRDNAASARGGQALLVNSFHAYAIDPDKFAGVPGVAINSEAAVAFLDWVTSPAGQAAVGNYLNGSADAPFLPSAAPAVTATTVPASVKAGETLTVRGRIHNVVPGTPPLAGETVRLMGVPLSDPGAPAVRLARTTTKSNGGFVFTTVPRRGYSYTVDVPAITKIENDQLSPVFGDLLAPTSLAVGSTAVRASVGIDDVTTRGTKVTVSGVVAPRVIGDGGRLLVLASRSADASSGLKQRTSRSLDAGQRTFTISFRLPKGSWTYQLRYTNPGVVLRDDSAKRTVVTG